MRCMCLFLFGSDFGFDPLRLGEVPENLERFKESELIHCRWAMLAVVSVRFKKS
jgi:light-harvesting complex I chlorophyll a/b binding protein 1